jgi:galactose mutarotase-like enzyme
MSTREQAPMGEATAVSKENVLIQAGTCAVTTLAPYGGKIASILVRGTELLQAPLMPVAARTQTMNFDQADAGGWDECLPSVASCEVTTEDGVAAVPDHGDLWRVPWEVVEAGARSTTMRGRCFSLPLELERAMTLAERAHGWELRLDYTLTNCSDMETPWAWAAHPLFVAEVGDRIVLPDSIKTLRLEGSGGHRLGKGGESVSWPLATLADGSTTDLSSAQGYESGVGDKLFAGPLASHENWAALERPKAGVRIQVSFNAAANPYLGLWICYGGWPQRPGPKQMCVALEPATAPVDALAERGPWTRLLGPWERFQWTMTVAIEAM